MHSHILQKNPCSNIDWNSSKGDVLGGTVRADKCETSEAECSFDVYFSVYTCICCTYTASRFMYYHRVGSAAGIVG